MKEAGVEVELLQDDECIEMMGDFIEKNKELWFEDIHKI